MRLLPVPTSVVALVAADMVLLATAFLVALQLAFEQDPAVFLRSGGGAASIAVVLAIILLLLYLQDFYSGAPQPRLELLQSLSMALGGALVLESLINYADPGLRVPARVMFAAGALSAILVFSWRTVYGAFVLNAVGASRVLLVGDSPLFAELAARIRRSPELGLAVVGCLAEGPGPSAGIKRLGGLDRVADIVPAIAPDLVVVGLDERRQRTPSSDLLRLRFSGFCFEEVESAYERVCGRVSARGMRPSRFLFSSPPADRRLRALPRILLNLSLAAVASLVVLPLILLVAAVLAAARQRPVLERRLALGLRGQSFPLYRFRPRSSGRLERLLRRFSLVDLPEFLNVLRGDMALVGPQPHSLHQAARRTELTPYYRQRLRVRPGLTGWAQIHTRPGTGDPITELEYDLYYVRNRSAGLDLFVLLYAVKRVIRRALRI